MDKEQVKKKIHNIKTPLNVFMNFLKYYQPKTDTDKDFKQAVQNSVDNMRKELIELEEILGV